MGGKLNCLFYRLNGVVELRQMPTNQENIIDTKLAFGNFDSYRAGVQLPPVNGRFAGMKHLSGKNYYTYVEVR